MRQPSNIQQMQPKFNSGNNDARYLLDQSQIMSNMNTNTNFLQPNISDHEFDLNFIQSNDIVSNMNSTDSSNQITDEVEQKQLVQLIQQGNEVNNYQYQNQSVKQMNPGKQNYQATNASSTFFQRQHQQQQFQQANSYNNSYNNSVQQQQMFSNQHIRIEQSSNMYQSPNNQTIINYSSNLNNDLMVNESGSVLEQLLLD